MQSIALPQRSKKKKKKGKGKEENKLQTGCDSPWCGRDGVEDAEEGWLKVKAIASLITQQHNNHKYQI